jgi:hypothetical protein
LNFFITHVTLAFGTFLESSEQPEVRQCQNQAVGRALNNLKSYAVAIEVATFIVWGLAVAIYLLFQPF